MWFYFVGYSGTSPKNSDLVLLGADIPADKDAMISRLLPVKILQDLGQRSKAKEVIIVLDTCRIKFGNRFIAPASLTSVSKVVVWSAVSEGEVTGLLQGSKHSAFTYAVLEALRGSADGEWKGQPDGKVTLNEANIFVNRFLNEQGKRDQTPELIGDLKIVLSEVRKDDEVKVNLGEATDFEALVAKVKEEDRRRNEEAARRAEETHKAADRAFAAERQHRLDSAVERVQRQAARDYRAIESLVGKPTKASVPALKAWLERYAEATVEIDNQRHRVIVNGINKVKKALTLAEKTRKSKKNAHSSRTRVKKAPIIGTLMALSFGSLIIGAAVGQNSQANDALTTIGTISGVGAIAVLVLPF